MSSFIHMYTLVIPSPQGNKVHPLQMSPCVLYFQEIYPLKFLSAQYCVVSYEQKKFLKIVA